MHRLCFGQRIRSSATLLVLVTGSIGCGHSSALPPRPAVATPAVVNEPSPTTNAAVVAKRLPLGPPELPASASIGDTMADHFMIASWARDSVIAGLLDPMRAPLTALADYRYDNLRAGDWMPWIAQLQEAAQLTSKAATLDAAAMGVATMARVCGECHQANHGGPALPPIPHSEEPLAVDSVEERMGRHMYGAELLWEGLTGPSDVGWEEGAKTLIQAPDELDQKMPEGFDADLLAVKQLGQRASDAHTLAERADVYGLLIASCASCHSRWVEHGGFEPAEEDSDQGNEWNTLSSRRLRQPIGAQALRRR